jgi:V8-like Glu-specific endopeptidase
MRPHGNPPPLMPNEVAEAFSDEVQGGQSAARFFPRPVPGTLLPTPEARATDDDSAETAERLAGYRPPSLEVQPVTPRMDSTLELPARVLALPEGRDIRIATTIFPPENRQTFSDTSFPWCTTGRVDTAAGWGSGVMVGPRHVLTASHAVVWNDDGTSGWLRFTPSYFDTSEPFGHADTIHWYAYRKVTPPTVDPDEAREDYAVLVLDTRLGDTTGWMGSRGYDDGWDGQAFWTHVGYPGDLSGGKRPSYEASIALNGSDTEPDTNEEIDHQGDVWPGQSGGPFFAWWSGDSWPRVVAVQSWQNASTNGASGGSYIPNLISTARAAFP